MDGEGRLLLTKEEGAVVGMKQTRTYHIEACAKDGVEARYVQISEDGEAWWICRVPRDEEQSWLQYTRQVQHLFSDEACRDMLFHTCLD